MSISSSTLAIVTGGSRGIGLATAELLVARGASVAITGTNQTTLDHAVALLGRGGARVLALRADVRDEQQVVAAFDQVIADWGGFDVLVNNAGVGGFAEVADMGGEAWRRVIDTNLTGVYHCCHAAIPHMTARGGGFIVNVSSLAGVNAFVGGAAYCASKAGLNAFSEALMQEVRHRGIRVSYIMPGSVRTGFSGGGDGPGTEWKLAPEDVAQAIVDVLDHPSRSLPSRVEIRASRPPKR
jgi:NAD(P)-dependent dehydrogenase (short-subunit alcohol dehydrogenase family)